MNMDGDVSTNLGCEDCNDDILMEVLIRLPVKSIFRCKCVSKRWHKIISDPHFRSIILSRCPNPNTNLFGLFETPVNNGRFWRFMPLSTPKEEETGISNDANNGTASLSMREIFYDFPNCFICSSNGLFLCDGGTDYYTFYYIFNPLSMTYYRLPSSLKRHRSLNPPCMGLVTTDTYKVVCVEPAISDGRFLPNIVEIETFSSETGEWDLSSATVSVEIYNNLLNFQESFINVVVIKGIIYWMHSYPDSLECIITYNVFNGGFKMIKVPSHMRATSFSGRLGESSDGQLHMAVLDEDSLQINIWVFQSNCCEWSRRSSMKILPARNNSATLFGFHPYNPDALFVESGGFIYVYHLNTDTTILKKTELEGHIPDITFNCMSNVLPLQLNCLQPFVLPPWYVSPLPLPETTGELHIDTLRPCIMWIRPRFRSSGFFEVGSCNFSHSCCRRRLYRSC